MITTKTTHMFPRFLLAALSSAIACGCVSQGPVNAPGDFDCAGKPSTYCILELAERSLSRISNDEDRVAGGLEFAVALHADQQFEKSRRFLDEAAIRAGKIQPVVERTTAFAQIAKVYSEIYSADATRRVIDLGEVLLDDIEDANKRQDLHGQLLSARAAIGETDAALEAALAMSQSDATLASYKARTLHEIAPIQAKSGHFSDAVETLARIDMGLSYYQATSRSDVANIAAAAGRNDFARAQLAEAVSIAREQADGYFIAGALRHVGETWAEMKDETTALGYFEEAIAGARTAGSQQEKGRALSRVATGLADHGFYDRAGAVIDEAVRIATAEETEILRYWSFYEITGSAAFAGKFAVALDLIERIPADTTLSAVPLRSVTKRDIAWGYARHQQLAKAVALSQEIETPRERVQSFSRIVRVMRDPAMNALPRYL